MTQITVYLTGGIAVYKAVQVVRGLEKKGHRVRVVMTKNAEHFVTSNTLAALTKYPVLDNLWSGDNSASIPHIALARWTQLALVVPASADFIAKMANGIADDAASTTILATSAPKIIVPAMNDQMLQNAATQRNLTFLRQNGVHLIAPVKGLLAEGYRAKGRLPEPEQIVTQVQEFLHPSKLLAGKKVVVTAGGTQEAIDPVRYLGNRSSGKMGLAIAQAAAENGAQVELIYGQVSVNLPVDPLINLTPVSSSEAMLKAVQAKFAQSDVLIMAAAVADWRMKKVSDHKLKKKPGQSTLQLTLVKTRDILKTVAQTKKPGQIIVGFAAETNDLLANATKKLKEKGADLMVANDVSQAVFGADTDQVVILDQQGTRQKWPRLSKRQIGQRLISLISHKILE